MPLSPATHGAVYVDAFDAVVPAALAAFDPQVLVTQLGCDTHVTDPLAHLALTLDDYHVLADRLHELAHTHAGGRWVAVGGGGYQVATVVPRAWTVYFARMGDQEVPHELPWDFLHRAEEQTGMRPPGTFLDGAVHVSQERVERSRRTAQDAVERLRRHAFPLLERR